MRNPNPRQFNPSRFEDDMKTEFESANGDHTKRNNYVFGTGRRQCQGMHISERSLFLAISRIIWGFNISAPPGKPLPDADEFIGALIVHPAHYDVVIEARSAQKASVVTKTWINCEESLLNHETKQWKKVPEGMKFGIYAPGKTSQ